jgi:hypothetical protein
MARKRTEHPPVHRTDLLPSNMTAGKRDKVLDLLDAYRAGAVLLGREQWRLFFETGRFNKNHDMDKVTFAAAIGAANRVQDVPLSGSRPVAGLAAIGRTNSAIWSTKASSIPIPSTC